MDGGANHQCSFIFMFLDTQSSVADQRFSLLSLLFGSKLLFQKTIRVTIGLKRNMFFEVTSLKSLQSFPTYGIFRLLCGHSFDSVRYFPQCPDLWQQKPNRNLMLLQISQYINGSVEKPINLKSLPRRSFMMTKVVCKSNPAMLTFTELHSA